MESSPSGETSNSLVELLKPTWTPNEIIKMFHEERERIEQRGIQCKNLLAETDSVLRETKALKDLYLYISPKTSQLHSECKNIIQERNDLKESYDKINYTLSKQEELRNIFKRMPEIKTQIFSILNAVCQKFQALNLTGANDGTALDEYYSKFFIDCRRIKELTGQLESCLSCATTDELSLYLEDIYRLYFDIREQLIEPIFSKNLKQLVAKADRNYCDLLQQSCASLVRAIRNEIQLFNQIFPPQQTLPNSPGPVSSPAISSNEQIHSTTTTPKLAGLKETSSLKRQSLNEFLDLLCKTFYEHLRPVIIHINYLETLTELYRTINDTIRLEVADECFQTTMNTLAEDIQERMAFRAEVFIQESILDYKPSRGDLAYPEKFSLVPGGDLKDYQSMWYPTVQRTVLALIYLNRVFDPLTFRELAHELVLACYKSLDVAQHLVDERHGYNKIDASLFLSKHLAIIIDQLQSYGIDQVHLPPPPPLLEDHSNNNNNSGTVAPRRPVVSTPSTSSMGPREAKPAAAAAAEATREQRQPQQQQQQRDQQ